MLSCANLLKFQLLPASKIIPIYHALFSTWCCGVVVWSSSLWGHNFNGPQVRIQVRTENVSVIFFCADFSTSSYLKLANHIFGGVHKQYGPKRERGRLFYPMYLMTWFIVQLLSQNLKIHYILRELDIVRNLQNISKMIYHDYW